MDFKNMTDVELESTLQLIEVERANRDEANKLLKRRKEGYCLKIPEVVYEYNYEGMWTSVFARVSEGQTVTAPIVDEILNKYSYRTQLKYEEIYPCPECNRLYLRIGNFGDFHLPKYAVTCNNCNFEMGHKKSDELSAWKVFHKWLWKSKYLLDYKGQAKYPEDFSKLDAFIWTLQDGGVVI